MFCKVRFESAHSRTVNDLNVSYAIVMRLLNDTLQLRQIFFTPGNYHRARLEQRKVHLGVDVQVLLVTILHAAQFEAIARSVETGMKDCAIAFTGA